MKNSILFLVNVDTFFVSHRLSIAKKLLDLGFEVHIITNFIKYEKRLLKIGFKTHHIDYKRVSFDLINIFMCIIKIALILLKIKPKIFHIISMRSIIIGGLASLIVPVKSFVFSITGIGSIYLAKDLTSKVRKFIVNLCLKLIFFRSKNKNNFIFQNKDDLKFLLKIYEINKKDITIVKGSGVIIKKNKFIEIKNKIPKILMVSRLIADKGVNEYIQAKKLCDKFNFKVKFTLIGDPDPGNPSQINRKIINKFKKDKLIKYFPYQKNINKFIKSSSIVVLPSYREGFPKILIEAASQGRPVITTNTPGCRDAIINKKTGILVPVKNSKALASIIMEISSNNKLLNKMGKYALKYAKKNFDIKDVVSKHIKVYEKLI